MPINDLYDYDVTFDGQNYRVKWHNTTPIKDNNMDTNTNSSVFYNGYIVFDGVGGGRPYIKIEKTIDGVSVSKFNTILDAILVGIAIIRLDPTLYPNAYIQVFDKQNMVQEVIVQDWMLN